MYKCKHLFYLISKQLYNSELSQQKTATDVNIGTEHPKLSGQFEIQILLAIHLHTISKQL